MTEQKVVTFFYGSYMDPAVLRGIGVVPDRVEVARLPGFDIEIHPLANLVPSDRHTVYGVLAPVTHAELGRLYDHARDVLGGVYLPHPVLASTLDGQVEPALCYIAPEMRPRPAESAYLDRILAPARAFGFPDWYLARLESFRA